MIRDSDVTSSCLQKLWHTMADQRPFLKNGLTTFSDIIHFPYYSCLKVEYRLYGS